MKGNSLRNAAAAFSLFMLVLLAGLMTTAAPSAAFTPQQTAALPVPPERPAVVSLRFGRHPDMTRIVIELSERTAFKVAALADPPRVVAEFTDLAPGTGALAEGPGVDLISHYQQESDGGGRRLVFRGAAPLRVKEAFMIPPQDGRQARLVVDVTRDDAAARREEAADGVALAALGREDAPAPPPGKPPVPRTAGLLAPPPGPLEPKPGVKPGVKPARTPLVVIDPGHGGADPGAIGTNGVYEKDITLATARELRRQLQTSGRYRVKLTRDADVFIRLRDRVAMAREAEADLFISLHADAIGSAQVRGLSVYTLSNKASDREAETLAAKENRADAIVGINLSSENPLVVSILIDLAQRDTMNHSKRFAAHALTHLRKDVAILASKPQREAGFAVLTAPDVPSVLVEMGYLSNPTDEKLLTSAAHRETLGRDMLRAIDAYFTAAPRR